ncbi:MFS transporter [Agrobacterium vitis]|uniref:MFS transporter n=1 Tax=Allorhizobium ampelinum TaxID=3025782 RepID=UPI00227798F4|nr:MFS transporter [Allorhizobium ampelinum]MCF1474459.1 MFS transporter [Allorhizobium ampelinum]
MNRSPFIALALADIVSLIGTRLSMIALPWLVLTTTHDPMQTGLIGFAEILPYVLAKALGGPWIDRLGARRVAIAGDLASMVAIALVPLLHFSSSLHFASLLPPVVLFGTLRGPADAAKQSMVPAVASLASIPLERVTGIMGTIDRLAGALGAAAAGALVAFVGPAPALVITAAACALAATIVTFGLNLQSTVTAATQAKPSYFAELREGWQYFRTDPVLVGIVMMVAMTNLFDQAYGAVLLPVWAISVGDASLLGALLATFSAGAVLGSGVATWLAPRLPRLAVYVIAYIIGGSPRYLVFIVDAPITHIFMVIALGGFACGFINPIISAIMFERIPPSLVGRVNSLIGALTWMLIPFGGLVGGAMIALVGLPNAFFIGAVIYFVVTMMPIAMPSFRALAHRSPRGPDSLVTKSFQGD